MPPRFSELLQVRFVRDIVTMQIGKIVPMVCGILTFSLYTRFLGTGGYGDYAVVLALTGVLGLVTNLGQQNTVMTFLSEAYGRKDMRGQEEVGHYYALMSAATVILLGIVLPFLPALTQWMYGRPEFGRLAQLVFVASMFDPVYNYFITVLQTVREIRFLTILENTYIVVQLGLSVLLLLLGYGVAGVLWGSLLTSIASALAALPLYRRLEQTHSIPRLRDILRVPGFGRLRRYAIDGLWIALDKNLGNLYPNGFLFILSLRSPPVIVGFVRLAFKLGNLASTYVLSNVSRLAATVIPTLAGRGGAVLHRNLTRLVRYAFALHAAATAGAMIAVPLFFPLLSGKDFSPALYPFFVISILHLILVFHALVTPILRLTSRVYLATLCNVAGMAMGACIFLLLTGSMGPTRALYLSLIAYHALSAIVFLPAWRMIRQDIQ